MTRFRLAAIAAFIAFVLLVPVTTAPGGEAPGGDYMVKVKGCSTMHTDTEDFVDVLIKLWKDVPYGRATASRLVPVKGAKVITKLKDLVQDDGDNVLDAKDSDRTNKKGVAKTQHEFNNFGNYKIIAIAKIDGEVVARDTRKFGVADRESGKCDPTIEI